MGYELYITRQEFGAEEDQPDKKIPLEEWLAYINNDPELELSDAYQIKVPDSETESMAAPGFCEWNAHPANERPWFCYSYGNIDTKNPDEPTIKKMLSIAETLQAIVQGDHGEIYRISPAGTVEYSDNPEGNDEWMNAYDGIKESERKSKKESKKPWWKFW